MDEKLLQPIGGHESQALLQLFLRKTHLKVLRVLEQAEMLTQRYHVVVANPPYMKSKFFNGKFQPVCRWYIN